MKKNIMLFMVLMFVGSVHAVEVIDMNTETTTVNQYSELIGLANQYEIAKSIGGSYNSIGINFDEWNIRLVIEFDNEIGITKISESDASVDLELNITEGDRVYLFENYQSMNIFEKINFMIGLDMDLHDILNFGAIAVSMRGA